MCDKYAIRAARRQQQQQIEQRENVKKKYIFFAKEERERVGVMFDFKSFHYARRVGIGIILETSPPSSTPQTRAEKNSKKKCHCNNVIISFMSCIAFMIVCVVYFITRTTSTKSKQSSLRERYRIEFCFVVNFAVLLRLFVWKVITRPLSSFARSRRVEESKK